MADLWRLSARDLAQHADRLAVVDAAEWYTYAVFAERCLCLAAGLREEFLRPGEPRRRVGA